MLSAPAHWRQPEREIPARPSHRGHWRKRNDPPGPTGRGEAIFWARSPSVGSVDSGTLRVAFAQMPFVGMSRMPPVSFSGGSARSSGQTWQTPFCRLAGACPGIACPPLSIRSVETRLTHAPVAPALSRLFNGGWFFLFRARESV